MPLMRFVSRWSVYNFPSLRNLRRYSSASRGALMRTRIFTVALAILGKLLAEEWQQGKLIVTRQAYPQDRVFGTQQGEREERERERERG
jgi:hypothetical protein